MGVSGGAVVTRKRMSNAGGKADTHTPPPGTVEHDGPARTFCTHTGTQAGRLEFRACVTQPALSFPCTQPSSL